MSIIAEPVGARVKSETARLLAGPLQRLNFGCGPHPLPGWTNIDGGDGVWYGAPDDDRVIKLDLFEALHALPGGVASRIYSEHLFEHFTLAQGHTILRQWCRALQVGGVVRIICPDLESEAKLLLKQISPASDDTIDRHRLKWLGDRYRFQPGERLTRAIVLNYGMWLDGHKFVYDAETLEQSMRLAGFEDITRCKFGESSHEDLRGIDSHDGGETGRTWVPQIALVMEGTKRREGQMSAHFEVPGNEPNARPDSTYEPKPAQHREMRLQTRLVEMVAALCAAKGYRRIALFGAGKHTAAIVHEPWESHGVRVVAVLDDSPRASDIAGVRVMKPEALGDPIDAVVVSSDTFENEIYARARASFGARGVPVLRIYADAVRAR
ncbi:MAG: hypothetical protein WC718_07980 [Phycisphaerales bacterium]|jgi:hypothetical protein